MKRSWIAFTLIGSLALTSLGFAKWSMAQEASKNEEKKEEKKDEKKPEITVKTTGKIILVGPDGKVIEKTFGDGEAIDEKEIRVEVKTEDGEGKKIILVTPEGKKEVHLNKVDVKTSEEVVEGKKRIFVEGKVIADGDKKAIVVSGDGKSFDVKGVGVDVAKIKKLIDEKKGDVKPEEIMAIVKQVEGKPIGGAMKIQLKKVEGKPGEAVQLQLHKVEGDEAVVVGTAKASASSSSDAILGKLDKILDRLEKLEERISKLEKAE